jgi:sialate O-acetylesterase
MIWPIHRYTIRGAIWYQGENNGFGVEAENYGRLFETLIRSWRELWGQGDFPFLYVQLPNFAKPASPSWWPEIREAQLEALHLRNTGMAVAIDVGGSNDVHPTNKRPVAERLVLAARALVYGEPVEYSGPIVRRVTAEAGALRLWFDHAAGLTAKGGAPRGFEIAGAAGGFVSAVATIDGETIVVRAEGVAEPRRVRYAWANDPPNNLYNASGLPASPLRVEVR